MTQRSFNGNASIASDVAISNLLCALEQSADVVIAFDSEWRYEYVNAAACDVLKRSRTELLGGNCWELFPELVHSETARFLRSAVQAGQPTTWNYQSSLKGSWVECHAYPLGERGLVVVMHGIEARVRAERAHHESELRFHTVANLAPCMIWMADSKGRPTWLNQRWLEYSGKSLEGLQTSTFDALHPEDRGRWVATFEEAATAKTLGALEARLLCRDGTYRWHLARAQPILDERGEISYWLGTAVDIQVERDALSAERYARRGAEEMRDHFHRVLAQAELALAVFIGPDHTLEVATRSAYQLLGIETAGWPARESLPREAIDRGMLQRLNETYSTGLPSHIVCELLTVCVPEQNGREERYVDTNYSALKLASGHVYGVLVTSVDVTAQTRARQYAELERQRLARVLDQAPFAVAITAGADHVLKSANTHQMRLFGQRTTLNMPARVAFPEKELEPVHALFDRAFRANEAIVLRGQRVGWDRTGTGETEYGYFDLIYQPIVDEHGHVEGLLCVSTDVSESVEARLAVNRARDEAEVALRTAESARDRLDNILAAIPTAIAVTRGPDHVYELVNDAYVRMSGVRDVLGRAIRTSLPAEGDEFFSLLDRVYNTGGSAELPARRVAYDKTFMGTGDESFFSSFFAPLKARNGQITGVVASALEVTDWS